MKSLDKIISLADLPAWRRQIRERGQKLVATNGCFDLLHAGHVTYLEGAREQGDCLLIGLNGDDSVRRLKGPTRPVNKEQDRALVLAALTAVDAVAIFPETTATRFLELAKPDVYVKGGDYRVETLDADERRAVEQNGGSILIMPMVPGQSTSGILRKLSPQA